MDTFVGFYALQANNLQSNCSFQCLNHVFFPLSGKYTTGSTSTCHHQSESETGHVWPAECCAWQWILLCCWEGDQVHVSQLWVNLTLKFNEQDLSIIKIYYLSSISAVIEPIPMGDAAKDYLSRYVSPTLLTGLTELCKKKPVDPFVSVSFHKSIKK